MSHSYVNIAVERANAFFSIQETDSSMKKGGKVTGRAFTNSALVVAAIAETVFFAALTALLSPLYFISHDRFVALKEHTKDAAQAIVNAGKGVAGYTSPKKKEAPPVVSLEKKEIEVKAKSYPYAKAAALIAAFAAVSYYFGPAAYSKVASFFAKNSIENPFAEICLANNISHPSEIIFA